MSDQSFGLATRTSMVRARQSFTSAQAAIEFLARTAIDAGLATEEFTKAIIAREENYPTGLPTAIPVAIPHIHDGCLRSFLACVTLTEPVQFASMEGDDEPLEVPIVFCFGITEPKQQAKVLRALAVLFQDAECLRQMLAAQTDEELLGILTDRLGEGITRID